MEETTDPNDTQPGFTRAAVREWMAALSDAQRKELAELHHRGELEAVFQRAVQKAVAARQLSALYLETMREALGHLIPGRRK
jgi:cell division inhibitor SulA